MAETVTAALAVSAVLTTCALSLLTVRLVRIRSDRRFETQLLGIDDHLKAISRSVAQALDQVVEIRTELPTLPPTLDFDALVGALAAEAAARTGAEAVVLRVGGPGQRPVVASFGPGVDNETLERAFGPPAPRAFSAATVEWTYAPADETRADVFRSSLVTPVGAGSRVQGLIAVYSTSAAAFRPEQANTLRALFEEAQVGLVNARRFAELERRTFVDPMTGVPDRRGYELELEREVARATRAGRPLSLILVALGRATASSSSVAGADGYDEFARRLTRITRGCDIPCRPGEREFAILLPGTPESGATLLTSRLREEARRALDRAHEPALAVGLVEWRPDEPFEALAARAQTALEERDPRT